jgi:hypothetical protein
MTEQETTICPFTKGPHDFGVIQSNGARSCRGCGVWDPPLPPPTEGFLEELRERARRAGWNYDYVVIDEFMRGLYKEAGVPEPVLDPYEFDKGSPR